MKQKKAVDKKIPEEINKERRYILIGMFSMYTVLKGTGFLSTANPKKKNIGTLVIANLVWKILAIIRFILKI